MDIYQIIITHNRSWTIREIIAFAVVFLIASFLAAVLLKQHKIVVMQAVCGLLLLTFLAIVFGSTVFTRTPGLRQYQLEVFWSWKEILGIGKCDRLGNTAEGGLLQENLLNILLLFPAGILLPGVTGRKLKWWMGLLVGITVSSAIEISQLWLCRGLFEFDDIIHNSQGCMLGCLLGNRLLIWSKELPEQCHLKRNRKKCLKH